MPPKKNAFVKKIAKAGDNTLPDIVPPVMKIQKVTKQQDSVKKLGTKSGKLVFHPTLSAFPKIPLKIKKKTGKVGNIKKCNVRAGTKQTVTKAENKSPSKLVSAAQKKKKKTAFNKQTKKTHMSLKVMKKIARNLGKEQKIQLANEVASAQLRKDKPSTDPKPVASIEIKFEGNNYSNEYTVEGLACGVVVTELVKEKPSPKLKGAKKTRKPKDARDKIVKAVSSAVVVEDLAEEKLKPKVTPKVERKTRKLIQAYDNPVEDVSSSVVVAELAEEKPSPKPKVTPKVKRKTRKLIQADDNPVEDASGAAELAEEKPSPKPKLTPKVERKTRKLIQADNNPMIDVSSADASAVSAKEEVIPELKVTAPKKRGKPKLNARKNVEAPSNTEEKPEPSAQISETKTPTRTKYNRKTKTGKGIVEPEPVEVNGEIKRKAPGPRKRGFNKKYAVSTDMPSSSTPSVEAESKAIVENNIKVKKPRGRSKTTISRTINNVNSTEKVFIDNQLTFELNQQTPASIKTSSPSLPDTFSWAHDLSLSSRTSTPPSLVCINGKIPTIPIVDFQKIPPKRKKKTGSPSDTSLTSNKKPRIIETIINDSSVVSSESTSSSSLSPSKVSQIELIENLKCALSRCDLVFLDWLGEVVDASKRTKDTVIQEATYVALKEEVRATELCQNIRSLSETTASENSNKIDEKQSVETEDPILEVVESKDDTAEQITKEEHAWDDVIASRKTYDASDDDDALSLYAESINFDSSKTNTSVAMTPVPEEKTTFKEPATCAKEHIELKTKTIVMPQSQVPKQTVTRKKIVLPSVQPITKSSVQPITKNQAVCEKQNADSTSINNVVPKNVNTHSHPPYKPSAIEPIEPVKAVAFKNFCFFNMAHNNCKNKVCRFPHTFPSRNHVKMKLTQIDDYFFRKEYLLLVQYPSLMARYLDVYVEECTRRNLTNLLLDMAIGAIRSEISAHLNVLESTLLHLNNVDLDSFKTQLMHIVQGHHLCDHLIKTIAVTQNFGRFKPVFIKLVTFMVSVNRKFNITDAMHIFERICILPYEESLSKVLSFIVKNTSVSIFENTFMDKYLSLLLERHKELHAELMEYKEQIKPATNTTQENPRVPINGVRPNIENKRYTSPDTTRLDVMQQKQEDMLQITRTVDLMRPRTFVGCVPSYKYSDMPSPSSDKSDSPMRRPHSAHVGVARGLWRRDNARPRMFSPMPLMRMRAPNPNIFRNFSKMSRPGYY